MAGRGNGRSKAKVKEPAPYAEYLEKEPTDLQDHLTGWILDKTGYEPENADDFAEGVRLTVALRMTHQASPENADRRAASEERSAATKAKAKAASVEEDEDEAPAPKRRGRPPKAKPAEEVEAPAPKRRGRPPKVAPVEEAPKTARKPPVKGRAKPAAGEDF